MICAPQSFCIQDIMFDCVKCFCVSYCSEQHREEDQERHKTSCRQLRIAMLADVYEVSFYLFILLDGLNPKSALQVSYLFHKPSFSKYSTALAPRRCPHLTLFRDLKFPFRLFLNCALEAPFILFNPQIIILKIFNHIM